MESINVIKLVNNAAEDKKAENIKIIDISEISVMADYMYIASGSNRNQIQAIADNILEQLHFNNIVQKSIEGYDSANWILIDATDVIIHIFDRESRDFYGIERLYSDGRYVEL